MRRKLLLCNGFVPALVLELKYNNKAETAINQIKAKRYTDSLVDYVGDVILVGVNYDKRTKKHQCSIERVTKGFQGVAKTFGESSGKSSEKSSEKILYYMKQNPSITIAELCKVIGLSDKGVRKNINKLKECGRLTRVGPDKGGWWKVEN